MTPIRAGLPSIYVCHILSGVPPSMFVFNILSCAPLIFVILFKCIYAMKLWGRSHLIIFHRSVGCKILDNSHYKVNSYYLGFYSSLSDKKWANCKCLEIWFNVWIIYENIAHSKGITCTNVHHLFIFYHQVSCNIIDNSLPFIIFIS